MYYSNILSISSLYFSIAWLRLTFSVGVNKRFCMVHSSATNSNLLIFSVSQKKLLYLLISSLILLFIFGSLIISSLFVYSTLCIRHHDFKNAKSGTIRAAANF